MFKQKSIFKFEVISTIFIMILGVILHFTYEWSNNNTLVGLFSPVNESIWEHLKLLYVPMFLTAIVGNFYYGKNHENYICAKTSGIIISMVFTVVTFYTYTGILGKIIDVLNIVLFFIAVILGQYIVLRQISLKKPCNKKRTMIVLILIGVLFIFFTFYPPNIGLFADPMTGTFGIKKANIRIKKADIFLNIYKYFFNVSTLSSCITTKSFKIFFTFGAALEF